VEEYGPGSMTAIGASRELVARLERQWRAWVVAITGAAVLVRIGVILGSGGGFDLRVYLAFARAAAEGDNPYVTVEGASLDQAVNLPLEHILFAALLRLHDSPDTLRVAFLLADACTLALIGLWPGRSIAWRLAVMTFYGFSPFVLYSWTGHATDKTLLLLGITALLVALERDRWAVAWAVTAALAAFKWIGAFWAVPLLVADTRARGWRAAGVAAGAFLAVFALAHLPYLPESLDAYGHRSDRLALDPPLHAALLMPLAEIGLYDPLMARLGTVALLLAVYVWHARGGLTTSEAIVLSIAAAYLLLPDQSDNRILLIVLPMLYVIRLTPARLAWLWAVSFVAAAALVVQLDGVPGPLAPIDDLLRGIFGEYGSLQHVLVMNVILVSVAVWFFADRRREPAA
jgi:hypothetical protein